MQLRKLGRSDIEITPLGLGCWQFSDQMGMAGKFWPSLADVPGNAIVKATLDGGVNWFDTAEMYGWGASEKCLAQGLQAAGKQPGEVVLATKWYPAFRTADSLLRTVDERKKNLAPYPIDLLQIHMPASFSTIGTEMKTMARLIRDGHIRTAGVSNYFAGQMRRAHKALAEHGHPLVSNQVKYHLLNRRIESNGVLETAKELGMTIIAYSPLGQGLVTGRFHDDPSALKARVGWRRFTPPYWSAGLKKSQGVIDTLKKIAAVHNTSPGQVALNWLVNFHGDTVVAIPGATRLSQAEQNVRTLDFTLSRDELNEIDEVSRKFK